MHVYLSVFVAKSFLTMRCYLERYLQIRMAKIYYIYPYSENLMLDLLKLKLIPYRLSIYLFFFLLHNRRIKCQLNDIRMVWYVV